MYKPVLIFVLLACLCLVTEAQLTFTSSWGGKRSAIAGSITCRNEETIAAIYKLIQVSADSSQPCLRAKLASNQEDMLQSIGTQANEAEKLLVCQKP